MSIRVAGSFVARRKGIYAEDGSGYALSPNSTFDNNLTYNNAINWAYNHNGSTRSILTSFQTAHDITGNPQYVSVGNYVLRVTSPAISRGEYNSYTPKLDLNGIVRPIRPQSAATNRDCN